MINGSCAWRTLYYLNGFLTKHRNFISFWPLECRVRCTASRSGGRGGCVVSDCLCLNIENMESLFWSPSFRAHSLVYFPFPFLHKLYHAWRAILSGLLKVPREAEGKDAIHFSPLSFPLIHYQLSKLTHLLPLCNQHTCSPAVQSSPAYLKVNSNLVFIYTHIWKPNVFY